ncbi:MAG: hypothetical protein KF864_00695 [Phycisphaeraceae bacterium]|nr:hypothetical protein [Phycisphaeraceae bacterium]
MIWESHPWKVDLGRRAAWLRKQQKVRKWPESALVRVEQCIMIGCYCVRKLVEAKKLTDRVSKRPVPLESYPAIGKPVTLLNWHKLDELYDFEKGQKQPRPLGFLCNQLIHSYVFVFGFNHREGLSFVLFCSDHVRNKNLFKISVRALANLFDAVARDDVWSSHFTLRVAQGGTVKDYDVKNR